jgi:hypothetical protein
MQLTSDYHKMEKPKNIKLSQRYHIILLYLNMIIKRDMPEVAKLT